MAHEINLLELHDAVNKLGSDLQNHMVVEQLTAKNQLDMAAGTRQDIKEYRVQAEDNMLRTREHFINKLETEHYNKLQIDNLIVVHASERRNEITKAVTASEKRLNSKVKWFAIGVAAVGSVTSFLIKYGATILSVIQSGDKNV